MSHRSSHALSRSVESLREVGRDQSYYLKKIFIHQKEDFTLTSLSTSLFSVKRVLRLWKTCSRMLLLTRQYKCSRRFSKLWNIDFVANFAQCLCYSPQGGNSPESPWVFHAPNGWASSWCRPLLPWTPAFKYIQLSLCYELLSALVVQSCTQWRTATQLRDTLWISW